MVEPECSDGKWEISAMLCDELDSLPVQLALSDPITGTEQSSIRMCDKENTLNLSETLLTKEHEICNETDTTAKRLHGNDHEHNELNVNSEAKPAPEEIPTGSVPVGETTGKDAHSHTVTQFKDTDTTTDEDAAHESICTATDPQTTYSVQEYKFEKKQ